MEGCVHVHHNLTQPSARHIVMRVQLRKTEAAAAMDAEASKPQKQKSETAGSVMDMDAAPRYRTFHSCCYAQNLWISQPTYATPQTSLVYSRVCQSFSRFRGQTSRQYHVIWSLQIAEHQARKGSYARTLQDALIAGVSNFTYPIVRSFSTRAQQENRLQPGTIDCTFRLASGQEDDKPTAMYRCIAMRSLSH